MGSQRSLLDVALPSPSSGSGVLAGLLTLL